MSRPLPTWILGIPLVLLFVSPCYQDGLTIICMGGPPSDPRELALKADMRSLNEVHPGCGTGREEADLAADKLKSIATYRTRDFRELLRDKDPEVCGTAALIAGRTGRGQYVQYILPLLKHKDDGVRVYATYAIGMIGDKKAIPSIRPLLKDTSIQVQGISLLVLYNLGEKIDRKHAKRLYAGFQSGETMDARYGGIFAHSALLGRRLN